MLTKPEDGKWHRENGKADFGDDPRQFMGTIGKEYGRAIFQWIGN